MSHTQSFQQYCRGTERSLERLSPSPDLATLGSGFSTAWGSIHSQDLLSLMTALTEIVVFTIFMDNFIEGRYVLKTPVELTDFRNDCQHQLMSLPASKSLRIAGQYDVDPQYESCRLACIAYSLLVVFPLPPTVGLFDKLVGRLHIETASLSDAYESFDIGRTKLHFWILAIGAIVSIGLPERHYFLTELLLRAESLEITSWPAASEVLRTFLWHPSTNSKDGLDLWRDMQMHLSTAGPGS